MSVVRRRKGNLGWKASGEVYNPNTRQTWVLVEYGLDKYEALWLLAQSLTLLNIEVEA